MTAEKIKMQINSNPVIAAVRGGEELARAVESPAKVIFVLNTGISKLREQVGLCRAHGKIVLTHFDLIEGLGADEEALRFLASFGADGILSTKNNVLKSARELGLFTVQRFFIVDSRSFETMKRSLTVFMPDMIEMMPGALYDEVSAMAASGRDNIICGGLIHDKQTVIKLLSLGASGVSTSCRELWDM